VGPLNLTLTPFTFFRLFENKTHFLSTILSFLYVSSTVHHHPLFFNELKTMSCLDDNHANIGVDSDIGGLDGNNDTAMVDSATTGTDFLKLTYLLPNSSQHYNQENH
jgi:hypothetical protein